MNMAESNGGDAASASPPHATMPSPEDLSNFRLIPEEVIKIIASFGDVASNVRLAATSPWFRRFVYKKCPSAWNDIDFGKVPSSQAAKLTDIGLYKLLTMGNAVQNTVSLSIVGCTSIQGPGLTALTNSRCLEVIDLRHSREDIGTYGETGLDDALVIGVLSSMAPINTTLPYSSNGGLKLVKFRQQHDQVNYYECHNEMIHEFLGNLNDAIARELRGRNVACETCERTLVDCLHNDEFSWKARTCYCSKCKSFKCCGYMKEDGKNYWYDGPDECRICMEQLCHKCAHVGDCNICKKRFCEDCRPVGFCDKCDTSHCQECKPFCSCQECGVVICEDCVVRCSKCEKISCEECNPLAYCEKCDYWSCSECNLVKEPSSSSCEGTCKMCNRFCSCEACMQSTTVSFDPQEDRAPKRPRLS